MQQVWTHQETVSAFTTVNKGFLSKHCFITCTFTYPAFIRLLYLKDHEQEPPDSSIHAAQESHPASSDHSSAPPAVRAIVLSRSIEPVESERSLQESSSDSEVGPTEVQESFSGPEVLVRPPELTVHTEGGFRESDETDVMLMDLYPVHRPERTVQATITSDGDSITVTGTDLSDVTASVISADPDAGFFVFHSALSSNRMHTNTRYAITSTRHEFEPKRYGKPCLSPALTKFRNLELFRVSNRSVSFIVSVYILHENIPVYPCFPDKWVTILCCAFNVARRQPSLFPSYNRLSNKRRGQYREAMAAMLPFECLQGTRERRDAIKDTVTEITHESGLDFISVFWDVIKRWAAIPENLDEDEKETQSVKYHLPYFLYGTHSDAHNILDVIPGFARSLTTEAVYSARAVGIKSAWQSKPCSVVDMNNAEAIRDTVVAHTALIHQQAKKILEYVANPKREIIVAIDIAHQFAPITNYTSFLCMGVGMANFAKAATGRTKRAERDWRDTDTNSAGESVPAVPFFLFNTNRISLSSPIFRCT
jgi:hypothetical protein